MKKGKVIFRRQTPIQEIFFTREPDGMHALYLDGNVQFVEGHDELTYHHALATEPARQLGGQKGPALVLGAGDGLVVRNLVEYPNIRPIRMVEIDGEMLSFATHHPVMKRINKGSLSRRGVQVEVGDARDVVTEPRPGKGYALVVLDFPDPDAGTIDLFGREFYEDVLEQLRPNGVLAVQASSAGEAVEKHVAKTLHRLTGKRPMIRRFRGKRMGDGSVVIARK